MSIVLKHCPLCGSKAIYGQNYAGQHCVKCPTCGCALYSNIKHAAIPCVMYVMQGIAREMEAI